MPWNISPTLLYSFLEETITTGEAVIVVLFAVITIILVVVAVSRQ